MGNFCFTGSDKRDVPFDKGRHWRARIGYVLLAMEQTIEDDVYTLTPEGVGSHFARIQSKNEVTVDTLTAAGEDLPNASGRILPEIGLDVVTYACTSGSFVIGEDYAKSQLIKGSPGAKASCITTGVIEAFKAFGAKKIVMGTPYLDEVNAVEAEYFSSRGFDILDIQGLNITRDEDMVRVPPEFILEFAKSLDRPDADLVFISCGALRSLDIIDELEKELGKPAVCSNQAMVWHALRLAGIEDKIPGYGRLFREH